MINTMCELCAVYILSCEECKYNPNTNKPAETKAASAAACNVWVSVHDSLPTHGYPVLCFGYVDSAFSAFFDNENNRWWVNESTMLMKNSVTHWMEMPPPPGSLHSNEDIKQLFRFYNVGDKDSLILAQEEHVARLQDRVNELVNPAIMPKNYRKG